MIFWYDVLQNYGNNEPHPIFKALQRYILCLILTWITGAAILFGIFILITMAG